MDTVYAVLTLIAGLGTFLVGVKLLSDNIEKLANKGLRTLFRKTSKSKFVGMAIGMATTAIVQSSGLTTVMVVGLVNAGVMTLMQATTMIMGANIGTTITAQIAALQAFDFAIFATALTGIGIFIAMLCKKEKPKIVGIAIAGLGLIFVGLKLMSDAMGIVGQSEKVTNFLASVNNPFLLLLIGIALTALVQSSSAVTSIVISMSTAGMVIGDGGNAALFIILGTNIGSCVTALLSSLGASTNAKRAGLIHLMFNVFGSLIFFIILILWKDFNKVLFVSLFDKPATQIAMFHTFFNVICTALFLPFSNVFVKISEFIIRDKKQQPQLPQGEDNPEKRLISTPAVALEQATNYTAYLLGLSFDSLKKAFAGFETKSSENTEEIMRQNEKIAAIGQRITSYLIAISSQGVTLEEEQTVSQLHHNVIDIVRISELADNITKYTERELSEHLDFSEPVNVQLDEMMALIEKLAESTKNILGTGNVKLIAEADALEDEIDRTRKKLIDDHIERLNAGTCKATSSRIFISLVSNLERAGDHLIYIARSVAHEKKEIRVKTKEVKETKETEK